MAWKERSRMDKRVLLVGEYIKGDKPMTELCREFGISRKTGYKWVSRYNADGAGALEDRSRAPLSHPSRIAPVVVEALVQARRAHPNWGPWSPRRRIAWAAVERIEWRPTLKWLDIVPVDQGARIHLHPMMGGLKPFARRALQQIPSRAWVDQPEAYIALRLLAAGQHASLMMDARKPSELAIELGVRPLARRTTEAFSGRSVMPTEPFSKPIAFEMAQRVFTAAVSVETTDAIARVPTITLTTIPGTPVRTLNAAAHYLALLAELGSGAGELWAIGIEIDRADAARVFVETVSNADDELGRAQRMLEDVLAAALMARSVPEGN